MHPCDGSAAGVVGAVAAAGPAALADEALPHQSDEGAASCARDGGGLSTGFLRTPASWPTQRGTHSKPQWNAAHTRTPNEAQALQSPDPGRRTGGGWLKRATVWAGARSGLRGTGGGGFRGSFNFVWEISRFKLTAKFPTRKLRFSANFSHTSSTHRGLWSGVPHKIQGPPPAKIYHCEFDPARTPPPPPVRAFAF